MKRFFFLFILLITSTIEAGSVPDFYGPLKKVTVNNASIAYYRFGYGAPLVMLTGHGDSMTMWHPAFLKKLSKNREVIIFDYPGIGESTITGDYPDSMDQLSKLVQSFISSQQLERPDMLGFSMGGSLLLYMATQNSSSYNHVVVVGAKAGGKKTIVPEEKYFKMLSDPKIAPDVAVKTLLFPANARPEADAYLKILSTMPKATMNGTALLAQAQAVNSENQGPGIWDLLSKIKNRTLVMNGTDDVLTPTQNAVMIASSIPGAWLMQIKGTGHGLLFQAPEFTGDLIELFLSY